MPWADGTPCGAHGQNTWCQKAKCVPRNRDALRPVDGNWGQWSPFSQCSLPCGGGIQSSHRYCDSPAPANYGKYCTGHRVKYRSCNTDNCPRNLPDVRSQQCREFDNNNFDISSLNQNVQWVPKYGGELNSDQWMNEFWSLRSSSIILTIGYVILLFQCPQMTNANYTVASRGTACTFCSSTR